MSDEAELMSWDIGRLRYEFRAAQTEIEIADAEIDRLKASLVKAEEEIKALREQDWDALSQTGPR